MRSTNISGRRAVCALLLLALSTTFAAWASARTASAPATSPAPVADKQPVEVELVGEVTRGGKTLTFGADRLEVRPGEVITWRMRVTNNRATALPAPKMVGPIPEGTTFVGDSAEGEGVAVDYSLDGQSYSPRPMVQNERGEMVPADPSTYKSVRFTFNESVAPGKSKLASYRTRVR